MLKSTSSMECFMLKSTCNLGETLLIIYAEVYTNFCISLHSCFRSLLKFLDFHLSNKTAKKLRPYDS